MTALIKNTEELIAIVKTNPTLWKATEPLLKLKEPRDETWRRVAKELGYTEIAVKKKWKNLKDVYRKELKKSMIFRKYQSCWRHFEDMEFMKHVVVSHKWTKEKSNQQSETDHDSEEERPPKKKRMPAKKKENKQTEESSSSTEIKKLNTVIKELKTLKETIQKRLPKDNVPKNEPDYQFLISLLPSMQKLSELQKIQFRSRVYDWLLELLTANEYENTLSSMVFIPQISKQEDS